MVRRCNLQITRIARADRQVDLSCFTKGKLCADGTLCSPNIAGKSQVGSLSLANMFNIVTVSEVCVVSRDAKRQRLSLRLRFSLRNKRRGAGISHQLVVQFLSERASHGSLPSRCHRTRVARRAAHLLQRPNPRRLPLQVGPKGDRPNR